MFAGNVFVETEEYLLLKGEGIAVFEKGFAVTRLAAFLRLTGEGLPNSLGGTPIILDGFDLPAEPLAED